MSRRQFFTRRAVTPCLAALILGVIAVEWDRGTATASATTAGGSMVQGGASCPLTSAQQVKSIEAWNKMMPVFRHPRCINCHGAMPKPLPQRVQVGGKWRGGATIRHAGVVDMDSTDSNRTCEECHMEDWGAALSAPNWTDKTDMELCSLMKSRFSAPRFVDHIRRDLGGVQFIKAAFRGERGLDAGAQTIYEAETGKTFRAEPPPGTHAQLTQQAQDWVTAQGGSFVGDDDCGCVLEKLEVLFHSTMKVANLGPGKETSTITGEGSVILDLMPPSELGFDATTTPQGGVAKIAWSDVTTTRPDRCEVSVRWSPPTDFKFRLAVSYKPTLRFSLEIVNGIDKHTARVLCPARITGALVDASADDMIGGIFGGAWMSMHGAPGAQPMSAGATAQPLMGLGGPTPPSPIDLAKLKAMDPERLKAMVEAMKNNPSPAAAAAQMKALMNQMVPGASQMAAAAKNNFRFAIPDNKWCKLGIGTAFLAQCDISQMLTVSDNKGSTQTITERTTITIGKPRP